MRLLLLSLVFFDLLRSTVSSSQYMRRHSTHHSNQQAEKRMHRKAAVKQPSAASSPQEFFTAGIASNGAMSGLKTSDEARNKELVAASLEHYKKQFVDARKLLAKAYSRDIYVDGFEVNQVSHAQRIKEYREEKADTMKDYAALEAREQEHSRKREELLKRGDIGALMEMDKKQEAVSELKTTSYNAMDAPRTGFWAKDRPDEERIDPSNMKIYTWRTYKLRFPFRHTWETETEWKKLPLAPKKIRKVVKSQPQASGAQLLEQGSGTALMDEQGHELVYTRNSAGYYFQGTNLPSREDQFRRQNPRQWQRIQNEKKNDDMYLPLYPDYTERLALIEQQLNDSRVYTRESAATALAGVIADMEDDLKIKPRTYGKAFVSISGAEGKVTGFNADVGKVTGKLVKKRIENSTGIPWTAQRILFQGKELADNALLNTVVGAGRGIRLSLHVRDNVVNHPVVKDTMSQKAKLPAAAAQSSPSDVTQVLLETKHSSPDEIGTVKHHKRHHRHSAAESDKLDNLGNAARKIATKELINTNFAGDKSLESPEELVSTNFADDKSLESRDEVDSDDGQDADTKNNAEWDFWGSMGMGSAETPTKDQKEAAYQATAQAVVDQTEKSKIVKQAPKVPEATTTEPPQHTRLLARTVYVKDSKGNWVVEQADTGKGNSHFGDAPDYGIPVEDRVQEDEFPDSKEATANALAQDVWTPREFPKGHLTMAEERKRMKHALSEEMKWKLSVRKADPIHKLKSQEKSQPDQEKSVTPDEFKKSGGGEREEKESTAERQERERRMRGEELKSLEKSQPDQEKKIATSDKLQSPQKSQPDQEKNIATSEKLQSHPKSQPDQEKKIVTSDHAKKTAPEARSLTPIAAHSPVSAKRA